MYTTKFLALAATFAITGSAFAAFDRDWKRQVDTANSALAGFGIEVWADEGSRDADPPDPDADPPDPDADPPDPDHVGIVLSMQPGAVYDFVVVAGDPPCEKGIDPPQPDADPPTEHPFVVTILAADGNLRTSYALGANGKLVELR